ncbi:MAG TPA: hypothetical protein VLZ09_06085 [Gaiellaceae bacterium]|nr:hypothetical protein [Gaiellaceae bacterium]
MRAARSWLVAIVVALAIVTIVWFLLAVPGCGSGSSGVGKL